MVDQEPRASFDRAQFQRDITAAQESGRKVAARVKGEWRSYRRNPQRAVEALDLSIRRMSDLHQSTLTDPPSWPVSPEEEFEAEVRRFSRLSRIVSRAGRKYLPRGYEEARELVAATEEIDEGINRVDNVISISPKVRQDPAGRALQEALKDSKTFRPRRSRGR